MTNKEIEEYCKSKLGAEVKFKEEWGCIKGDIENKMFVMIGGDKKGEPIVTVKCEPELNEMYRKQYEDIVPGYYMNKIHWNSIYYTKNTVPDKTIIEMIDMSYDLILNSLPKKLREKYI